MTSTATHKFLFQKCIPAYKDLTEWMKEMLTKNNLPTVAPTRPANSSNNHNSNYNGSNSRGFRNNRQQYNSAGPSNSNKPHNDNNRLNPQDPHGVGLCHDYNKPDGNICKRKPATDSDNNSGCKDASGTFYLHQCSQWINKFRSYCNRKHPRRECRFFRR